MAEYNEHLAVVTAFTLELQAAGVRHVVVSPGSRSAPLTIASARCAGLSVWNILDERSAAFFALGLARGERTPTALICTSGTAAANYLPAVVEAYYSRVPLLLLTADRPPEGRGIGGNQTIEQRALYGSFVKWTYEMPVPEATPALITHARVIACRAVSLAVSDVQGPVHLNWPLREPLLPPVPNEDFERSQFSFDTNQRGARPLIAVRVGRRDDEAGARAVADAYCKTSRGLIVCGPRDDEPTARAAIALARRTGWPLLADPLSQARMHPDVHVGVIAGYDTLLRVWDSEQRLAAAPDVIVRVGATPTSKVLGECLALWREARQIVVDENAQWSDPALSATDFLQVEPAAWLAQLAAVWSDASTATGTLTESTTYAQLWQTAEQVICEATSNFIAETDDLTEGRLIVELADALPESSWLFVGNSMPVRDLDSFLPRSNKMLRILANRGASGIDGVVSSALGTAVAATEAGTHCTLVLGDLSFLHDMGGLLAATDYAISLTIIVIHNDGGGIFSFLPPATQTDVAMHFATPHGGVDLQHAARLYRGRYALVTSGSQFRDELTLARQEPGFTLLEVRTDKADNVAWHRQLWQHGKQVWQDRADTHRG